MMQFRVTWAIDIEADTAREAAEKALEVQRDPESTAVIFEVKEFYGSGEFEEIDLLA